MHRTGLSIPTPRFCSKAQSAVPTNRWTKSMGKPSTQNLKVHYNVRRSPYVRR